MSSILTARLPEDVAAALESHCADMGASKTAVVVSALRKFLSERKPRPTAYELALPLIPAHGLPHVQARNAKHMLREKFKARSGGR